MCVISALLTDEDSGKHFAALLEEFYLANRDCGKNLLMGILADLREAKTETVPGHLAAPNMIWCCVEKAQVICILSRSA